MRRPGDVLFAFLGAQDCKSVSLRGLRLWETRTWAPEPSTPYYCAGPRLQGGGRQGRGHVRSQVLGLLVKALGIQFTSLASVFSICRIGNHKNKSFQTHGIWSHHFMANRWGNNGNSDRLYFLGLQSHCR